MTKLEELLQEEAKHVAFESKRPKYNVSALEINKEFWKERAKKQIIQYIGTVSTYLNYSVTLVTSVKLSDFSHGELDLRHVNVTFTKYKESDVVNIVPKYGIIPRSYHYTYYLVY